MCGTGTGAGARGYLVCLFAVLLTGQNSKPDFNFPCLSSMIMQFYSLMFSTALWPSAVGCIEKELHGLKVGGVSHWISVFACD